MIANKRSPLSRVTNMRIDGEPIHIISSLHSFKYVKIGHLMMNGPFFEQYFSYYFEYWRKIKNKLNGKTRTRI